MNWKCRVRKEKASMIYQTVSHLCVDKREDYAIWEIPNKWRNEILRSIFIAKSNPETVQSAMGRMVVGACCTYLGWSLTDKHVSVVLLDHAYLVGI